MNNQIQSSLQQTKFETTRRSLAELSADPLMYSFLVSKELSAIHKQLHDQCAKDGKVLRSVDVVWVEDESGNYFRVSALRTSDNRSLDEYKDGVASTISTLVEA